MTAKGVLLEHRAKSIFAELREVWKIKNENRYYRK